MYLSSCLPRVPIEGILKIVAASIGIAGNNSNFSNAHEITDYFKVCSKISVTNGNKAMTHFYLDWKLLS